MNTLVAMVYLGEIQRQAEYALNAVEQVNSATRELGSTPPASADPSIATAEVFRGLHSFLAHTSNISRLLWPAFPRRRTGEVAKHYQARTEKVPKIKRASRLRELLGLQPDDHPLKSRQLRDHLEHFDERLDDWSETSESHDFVQEHIGPESQIAHLAPRDRLRSFDPALAVFCFRGERFELGPLVKDIRKLKERAAMTSFRLHMGSRQSNALR
jgi:hypothetical protein